MASNSTHTIKIAADFSDATRKIIKFGESSADLIGKAQEAGVLSHLTIAYQKATKLHLKLVADSEKQNAALKYAYAVKGAKTEEKMIRVLAESIAKREAELQDRNLKDDVRKKKKAALEQYKLNLAAVRKIQKEGGLGYAEDAAALVDGLKDAFVLQKKYAKDVTNSQNKMLRGQERSTKFMKMFTRDATRGADDIAESLGDAAEGFKDSLKGIDLGSMFSKGGKGIGKGLGSISEMIGGLGAEMGGAMGGLATGLASVLAVLGPLVIVAGLFGAALFEMDKEVKALNKSAINTFGTRGVMSMGMPKLEDNLKVLRHATQDLTATLGLTEDEAMGVFDAFDAGGITLKSFTKGTQDAQEATDRLAAGLRGTVSVAKSLGVSVNEFATNISEYTTDMATSLEGVTNQFALIGKQAQEAGFSTRRFYSMVVQATAGQASLNTHLDQTGALLVKMSKVLGQKQAAEVLGSAAQGFKDTSTQERYKTIMTTGAGRTKGLITDSAERQARNLARDFSGTDDTAKATAEAVRKAVSEAGVSFDFSTLQQAGTGTAAESGPAVKNLVKQLAGMNRKEQSKLIAAVQAGDPAMGRRISQLVGLARGTNGSMADMSDAMGSMDPGAVIAMKLQQAAAILGRPLNELSGVQRMAAESITGLSGSQYEQYSDLARSFGGQFAILEDKIASGMTETPPDQRAAMAEQYGAIIENGKVVSASVKTVIKDGKMEKQVEVGGVVENGTELLAASIESGDQKILEARTEAMDLAYDAFDATTTIGDILENKILYYLRGLYEEVGQPLMTWLAKNLGLGGSSEKRQAAISARGALSNAATTATNTVSETGRTIARLQVGEAQDTLTVPQKAELEAARNRNEEARAQVASIQTTLRELATGNYRSLEGSRAVDVYSGGGGNSQSREFGGDDARRHVIGTTTESYTRSGEELARNVLHSATLGVQSRRAEAAAGTTPPAGTTPSAVTPPAPLVPAGAAAPTPTPTPAPAPVRAPTPAPRAPTTPAAIANFGRVNIPAAPPSTTDAKEAVLANLDNADVTTTTAEETQKAIQKAQADASKHLTKIFTRETKLGDALARSNLPDAIVAAQVKQQIAALASAAGLNPQDAMDAVQEFSEEGTYSKKLTAGLTGMTAEDRASLNPLIGATGGLNRTVGEFQGGTNIFAQKSTRDTTDPSVDDFIYRGDGVRGNITPIDTADQFVGMKPGGPVDQAMRGGGGGGNVTINIYGGDERKVFDVVKRVLTQSGIGPGRVAARA